MLAEMTNVIWIVAFVALLFCGMLVMLELGRRIRRRQQALHVQGAGRGIGTVEGAMFALLGLLIAFTFSGAASRFDVRRQLVVEEANDIGTAYLRIDLLPQAMQPPLREKFRNYVDARLAFYRAIPDFEKAAGEHERVLTLQSEIWRDALSASQQSTSTGASILLLPALNAMIDITTTRTAALRMHPPLVIFFLLGAITLASSLFAGYSMGEAPSRSWLHMLGFSAILALSIYVILDLEYPRVGLINLEAFDQVLVDVRNGMK
jgi:hypothetical protein